MPIDRDRFPSIGQVATIRHVGVVAMESVAASFASESFVAAAVRQALLKSCDDKMGIIDCFATAENELRTIQGG